MAYRETEHEAFVVSKLEHEYFAYCKDVPKDLIIDANLSPKGVDILGKWVRVSVHRGNVVCRPVRIIDNLYESRIWNATPQIKVKIEYDGIHGNNLKMFFNDYLGFVSDPHEVMANFDRCSLHQVWIERYKANGTNSRWGISKTQDNHSRAYSSNKTVRGIIHSYENGVYYAWSESEPRCRISIDSKYCTRHDCDYLGRWVEIEIDANKNVQSELIIINDLFNTFCRSGFVEIEVEFESQSSSPGSYFHPYFGNICDPRMVLEKAEKGATYSGKITYFYEKDIDSRWRLAIKQTIYGPLTNVSNRSSGADFYNYTERKMYSRPQSENGHRRDSSPEIVNLYRENYRNSSRNSDRFTPPRHNGTDRGNNQDRSYYDDRENYGYKYRQEYSDDDRELRSPEYRRNNHIRDYDRHDNPRMHSDDMSYQKHNMGENPSDFPYRSQRSPSPTFDRFERRHSPNAYPSERVEIKHFESSEKLNLPEAVSDNKRCASRVSRAPTTDSEDECIDEEKNAHVLFRSFDEKQEQLTNRNDKPQVKKSVIQRINTNDLTTEDKEIIILTSKINQIRTRFEFFTADEGLNQKMKFLGVEEYEALANLLKLV